MVTFLLPAGPKNLASLFPAVNFDNVEEYYIELKNGGTVYVTTPHFHRLPCCGDDIKWLYFVNYSGAVDCVPFLYRTRETEVKSARWKKPLGNKLKRWDGGWQRISVTSNQILSLECTFYDEREQPYLEELLATPNAWIFSEGRQGLSDTYVPVLIHDGKFTTRKENERYFYGLQIEVSMANENQIPKN